MMPKKVANKIGHTCIAIDMHEYINGTSPSNIFLYSFFCFILKNIQLHKFVFIMFQQHIFGVYKGIRKLKLLITCENFLLFV